MPFIERRGEIIQWLRINSFMIIALIFFKILADMLIIVILSEGLMQNFFGPFGHVVYSDPYTLYLIYVPYTLLF